MAEDAERRKVKVEAERAAWLSADQLWREKEAEWALIAEDVERRKVQVGRKRGSSKSATTLL